MQPSDLRELAETIQSEADAIAACAEEIDAAGAQIKSLEEGLLDFPSRREGSSSCCAGSSERKRSSIGTASTRASAGGSRCRCESWQARRLDSHGCRRKLRDHRAGLPALSSSDEWRLPHQCRSHSRRRNNGARRHRARADAAGVHACSRRVASDRAHACGLESRRRGPRGAHPPSRRPRRLGRIFSQRPLRRVRRRVVVLMSEDSLAQRPHLPDRVEPLRERAWWFSSTASSKLCPACASFRRAATRLGTRACSSSPKAKSSSSSVTSWCMSCSSPIRISLRQRR